MKLSGEKNQVSEKMDEVHWPTVELELGTREKKAGDVGRARSRRTKR